MNYFPKYTSRKMDLPYSAEHRDNLMWDLTERARSSQRPSKREQSHLCGKLPNAGNSSWNIQSHTEMQTQAQTQFFEPPVHGQKPNPHAHTTLWWLKEASSFQSPAVCLENWLRQGGDRKEEGTEREREYWQSYQNHNNVNYAQQTTSHPFC